MFFRIFLVIIFIQIFTLPSFAKNCPVKSLAKEIWDCEAQAEVKNTDKKGRYEIEFKSNALNSCSYIVWENKEWPIAKGGSELSVKIKYGEGSTIYESPRPPEVSILNCLAWPFESDKVGEEIIIKPKIKNWSQLQLPRKAISSEICGWVSLNFTVTVAGKTKNISVESSSSPMFEKNAIKAVKRYEFYPATRNDEPIEYPNHKLRVSFEIEGCKNKR